MIFNGFLITMKGLSMMHIKSKGFTLIELMIAVIIVGILAAVAVPMYQNYAAKAQFSEALTISEAAKLDAINQMIVEGSCKNSDADIEAAYISSVNIASVNDTCTITVTFKEKGVNAKLAGQSVQYTLSSASDSVRWVCQTKISPDIAVGCND